MSLALQIVSELKDFDASRLPHALVPGLYVHVPFCFHKCHYCDFYSITRQTPERMEAFVDGVLDEARRWQNTPQLKISPGTVFMGGGTPSLLPFAQMERLVVGLRSIFDFSRCTEWTVEVNPATAELGYCQMLKFHGVTRLSFGAQSFDLAELKMLERHHDPEDVPHSLEIASAAGFDRTNLDLIFAIPGQSLRSWERSLDHAISLGTTHLSCYALTYEPNTAMAVRKRLGHFSAVEESLELDMLHLARERLAGAGFTAYEISNFARPAQECRHNLLYWTGGSYIGLGPSAASHVHGHRWKNQAHLRAWEESILRGELPVTQYEVLSSSQRAGELAMLLLRLERGIEFQSFASRTGSDAAEIFADPIARFTREGLLASNDESTRLTAVGICVADAIAAEFLACCP